MRSDGLYATAAMRLTEADANPEGVLAPFEEMQGEEAYRAFLNIDTDDVPDGELFLWAYLPPMAHRESMHCLKDRHCQNRCRMSLMNTDNRSSGKLVIVPTPIGNLGDMTLRSLEALREADVVCRELTKLHEEAARGSFAYDLAMKAAR